MEALGLNLADWFILIVLIASGIISFARGFTKEFLSLFLWLAAYIIICNCLLSKDHRDNFY